MNCILTVVAVFSFHLIYSSGFNDTVVNPEVEDVLWTSQTFLIPTGLSFSSLDTTALGTAGST